MECFILRAEGTKTNLGKVPRLEEAKKIVGGWVEQVVIHQLPPLIMLVNEEAKMKKPYPPVNQAASELFGAEVLGDVLVMDREAAVKGKWL